MIASTMVRASANGLPARPVRVGSIGAINSHWVSESIWNRDMSPGSQLTRASILRHALAAWVSAHPRAHGWYGESAYVFNESPLALRIPSGAHRLFGSTIIQRWDLARVPAPDSDVDPAWADQVYGSHIMSVGLHARSGAPLEPLPFDVGAYRVGTGQNVSGFDSPFRVVGAALGVPRRRWPLLVRPRRQVRRFGPA